MKIKLFKKKEKKTKKEKTLLEKFKSTKRKTKLITAALILSIAANLSIGAYQHNEIVEREREIESQQVEIQEVNDEITNLTEQLKAGEIKENEYEEKIKKLEEEKEDLNEQLQAKLKARTSNAAIATSVPSTPVQGSCLDWIRAAGVTDEANAYTLIMRESGCNVYATNASSGAYGIPQALPGSKMASAGSDWQTNPVTQIRWMQSYVVGRYGSWANAVVFWNTHHWY